MKTHATRAAAKRARLAGWPSSIARLVPVSTGASEIVNDHGRRASHHASTGFGRAALPPAASAPVGAKLMAESYGGALRRPYRPKGQLAPWLSWPVMPESRSKSKNEGDRNMRQIGV